MIYSVGIKILQYLEHQKTKFFTILCFKFEILEEEKYFARYKTRLLNRNKLVEDT